MDLIIFKNMVEKIYSQLEETTDVNQFQSKYMARVVRQSSECVTSKSSPLTGNLQEMQRTKPNLNANIINR